MRPPASRLLSAQSRPGFTISYQAFLSGQQDFSGRLRSCSGPQFLGTWPLRYHLRIELSDMTSRGALDDAHDIMLMWNAIIQFQCGIGPSSPARYVDCGPSIVGGHTQTRMAFILAYRFLTFCHHSGNSKNNTIWREPCPSPFPGFLALSPAFFSTADFCYAYG